MRHSLCALAALVCMAGAVPGARAADLESPAAINGTGYAIIPQLFDGSTGSTSYIRLFNGNSGNTTFSVLVINTSNGITVGSAAIAVPPYASPQYPLTGSGNSIFTLAGVAPSANAAYALYIQDTDVGAGYAHVTYNGISTLFENQSACTTPLNQRLTSQNRQALVNVHTTALAGNNYPSIIGIHNYATGPISVRLTVYDAATGANIGNVVQTIAGNGTLTLPESQLESLLGFTPTGAQSHLNIIVTHTSGTAAPVTLTHTIRNIQLGGEINMTQTCAVNALSATTTTPVPISTLPTAYCGSFLLSAAPYPLSSVPFYFNVSVATNGRAKGTIHAEYNGVHDGDYLTGTVAGTTLTAYSQLNGTPVTGTVENGSLRATFASAFGVVTVTGSTSACSN